MLTLRRYVREQMLKKPKTKRLEIILEAGLTETQTDIMIRKLVHRQSNVQISLDIKLSLEAIDKNIAKSYDVILEVLKECGTK